MKKLLLLPLLWLALSSSALAIGVSLNWNDVTTYSDGSTIPAGTSVKYDVFRATLPDLSNAVKLNAIGLTTSSYTDSSVVSGNTYYYFTRAYVNTALPSTNSNVVATVLLTPSAPTNLTGVIVP